MAGGQKICMGARRRCCSSCILVRLEIVCDQGGNLSYLQGVMLEDPSIVFFPNILPKIQHKPVKSGFMLLVKGSTHPFPPAVNSLR
jgi:hypothetical protein